MMRNVPKLFVDAFAILPKVIKAVTPLNTRVT